MVVGSKGWAERRYTWGEGRSGDVWYESNTEGHSEGVFPVEYRRTDAVLTVVASEVLRFECLSRCYPSVYSRNVGGSTLRVPVEVLVHGAYSRNVGGSTLRVPVEVLFQCLQSQRRRFYASSACRGAIPVPTVATSEVLRSECLHMSRCYSGAYSRNVGGSTLRVPVEVLFHGAYLRNVGGSTLRVWSATYDEISRTPATSRRPPPPLRQNQDEDQTSPQRQERTVSWFQVVGRAWGVLNDHRWCPGFAINARLTVSVNNLFIFFKERFLIIIS